MSSKGSRKTDDLFRVGKEKGFVTLDDIIYGSPETQSAEEIDDLLTELSDYGIDVVGQDSEAPGEVPAGAEDLVLETEREAASEVVSAPEPRDEARGDTELPSSADPVSIYMRQLRQVPLLSRRAEVDAAKRLEAGRLDGVCAALDTAIAAEEMRRLMRRWREREPDVLEPMELRGAGPEGGETEPIPPLTPVEVVEALAELHHQNKAIQRALTPDPQKSEEERATELQRLKDNRTRMLELLRLLPWPDVYLRRVAIRAKSLAVRLEDAQEIVNSVEAETGLSRAELRSMLSQRRRAKDEAKEGSSVGQQPTVSEPAPQAGAERGRLSTTQLGDQVRRLKNAVRRIRALEKRAGASVEQMERVHQEILAAELKAQRAKDELVLANQRLVVHIAGRYANRGLPFLELVQEGNLGLMRAVDKFDYRRGYKFSTYGTWWIRHAISRAIANQTRTIRLPVHVRESIRRLVTESQAHVVEFGREPTTDELAQRLEIPVERVVEIIEASRKTLRWELPVGEDGETELGTLISDKDAPTPFEEVSNKGQWEQIVRAMSSLRERDREVMRRRFGLDGRPPQTLEEVGKELGITRERVRQIQARSIRKIQVAVRAASRTAGATPPRGGPRRGRR